MKLNTCRPLAQGWQLPEAPSRLQKEPPPGGPCRPDVQYLVLYALSPPHTGLDWGRACECWSLLPSGQGPSCPLDPLWLLGQPSSGISVSQSSLGEKGSSWQGWPLGCSSNPLVKGEAENWIPYPQQLCADSTQNSSAQREECAKTFFRAGNRRCYFVLGG